MRYYGLFLWSLGLVVMLSAGCAARHVSVTSDSMHASGDMRGDQKSGTWQYTYADGALQAEGPWRRDQRHGVWQYWYPDGTQEATGRYEQGLRQGWWRHYHEGSEERVASEGLMVDDRQHGLWLYRHTDGQPAGVGVFAKGSRMLSWQRFTTQGSPSDAVILFQGTHIEPEPDARGYWHHGDAEAWIAGNGDGMVLAQIHNERWLQYVSNPHRVTVVRSDEQGNIQEFWHLADGRLYRSAPPDGLDLVEAEALQERAALLREDLQRPQPQLAEMPLAPLVVWPDMDANLSPAPSVGLGGLSLLEEQRLHTAYQVYSGEGQFTYAAKPSTMPGRRSYGPASSQQSQQNRDQRLVGQSLPQRRFIQADGSVLDLSRRDSTQLIVILRGFAGNICPYCGGQSKALLQHQEAIAERGADLTFVYPGSSRSLPDFLRAVQRLDEQALPPFTVALDVDLQLVQALEIGAELAKPTSLIVDAEGTIRYAYIGQDLMDRPTVPDILDALERMAEEP
ncbi:MAG: hypothetical protein EA401_07310 [Planctomycetota bacterium]|nr:MAG: hypothetical protein EA401_07310 [Planctomycetota bacterium]